MEKRRMGGSEAETIRQPRDRLIGQPQERQHRAAVISGTRDRLPPARGADYLARGIVTAWPRPGIPLAGSAGAR